MSNRVTLDSGVIAAIFFKEKSSDRAEKVAESYELITLDLAVAEISNVAWKRVMFFNESKEVALKALKKSVDFIFSVCDVINSHEIIQDAFEIAIIDEITMYDSFFIAASEREMTPLLTTDRKLYEKVKLKRKVKMI